MHLLFPRALCARHLVLGGLMLAAAVLQPVSAFAHFEGGSWAWGGGHNLLWLNYDNNCSPWTYVVDTAINSWNYTNTPIWFNKLPSGCNPMDNPLDVYTGFDSNPGKLAWTQNYERDCFFACWWDADFDDEYQHSIIRMNTQDGSFGSLSFSEQRDAMIHELGHTLGVAHAGYYAGEYPDARGYPYGVYSAMDYCCPSDFTGYPWYVPGLPAGHDVGDINVKYPGW